MYVRYYVDITKSYSDMWNVILCVTFGCRKHAKHQ